MTTKKKYRKGLSRLQDAKRRMSVHSYVVTNAGGGERIIRKPLEGDAQEHKKDRTWQ